MDAQQCDSSKDDSMILQFVLFKGHKYKQGTHTQIGYTALQNQQDKTKQDMQGQRNQHDIQDGKYG